MGRAFSFVAFVFILSSCSASHPDGPTNSPLLLPGSALPDGRLGAFSQIGAGDCFFLAALLAIANDADGIKLIESSFHKIKDDGWQVVFPNLPQQPISVSQHELQYYRLLGSVGTGLSAPAAGDADIAMLEIAANKLWKKQFKPQGLWDDVPMNAFFLFSSAPQSLLWNRKAASSSARQDIDQYHHFADAAVTEINVSSLIDTADRLQRIVSADRDGLSLVLIDYDHYHAIAVSEVDFQRQTYRYINTNLQSHLGNMTNLLKGLIDGHYALNYMEIG